MNEFSKHKESVNPLSENEKDYPEHVRQGLEELRAMIREAEEDVAAGRVGPFDREAIERAVRERLAREGIPPMQPHILMCPPDYYGIEYEINPWMNRERPSDHGEATRQWRALHAALQDAGAKVSLLEPVEGLPDLVFTANAAMIFRDRAILSAFRHPQRQGEEPYDEAWLAANGFRVEHVPEGMYFEGAGDALFCGDTLFAGYRFRSDAGCHQEVGRMIGRRVIPLELVDAYYYHLDTCFCPLRPGAAIYFPGAFDSYGRQVLEELVEDLIPVEEAEARRFACNAVVVGQTVVTNTGCPRLHQTLIDRGFTPRETPLDEFVKAGGSAKCLTLRLDGEEAAGWKE